MPAPPGGQGDLMRHIAADRNAQPGSHPSPASRTRGIGRKSQGRFDGQSRAVGERMTVPHSIPHGLTSSVVLL